MPGTDLVHLSFYAPATRILALTQSIFVPSDREVRYTSMLANERKKNSDKVERYQVPNFLRASYGKSGTDVAHCGIALRACYAMSSTHAARSAGGCDKLVATNAQVMAMRCSVLRSHTVYTDECAARDHHTDPTPYTLHPTPCTLHPTL
eukprot:3941717-Rhodomonas_salina.1